MASSSSDDQQSKSKHETSPPPPMGAFPPPTMGYPPNPGHHPGYPPPPPYHYQGGYPYSQAPPAAYYTTPNQQKLNSNFLRGIISALILLILLICLSSFITWLILRPEIPIFKVHEFSVTNLNLQKSNYSGFWSANVTVENPNRKLNVRFDKIQSFVDFKERTLSMSFVDPFSIDVKKSGEMEVKLSSVKGDVMDWEEAMGMMEKEKLKNGVLSFDLRFFVWTTMKSGSWWTKNLIMRVFCEDLKLGFHGIQPMDGVLLPDSKIKPCLVYV